MGLQPETEQEGTRDKVAGDLYQCLKSDLGSHRCLDIPSLYFAGKADWMTPLTELKQIVKQRNDCGRDVGIREVEGGDHPLRGHENEVAVACAEWIRNMML